MNIAIIDCMLLASLLSLHEGKNLPWKGEKQKGGCQVVNPVQDELAGEGVDANNTGTSGIATACGSSTAEPTPVPQNRTVQHEQQNGSSQANAGDVHTSAEASIVAVESGVSSLNTCLECSPNQPFMVEHTADNPAWTESKGT